MREETTKAAIEEERRSHPVRPHIVAQASSLPLLDLHSRQFELLTHALLEREARDDGSYDRASLLLEGPDRARDILLYRERELVGIVQCKRKVKALGIRETVDELLRYCLHAARDPQLLPRDFAIRYELWTAVPIQEKARQFFDDEASSSARLAELGPADVERARGADTSLSAPEDTDALRREVSLVLQIASRLKLKYVGPERISLLLHRHTSVRRGFFRSPDDEPPRAGVEAVAELVGGYRNCLMDDLTEAGAVGDAPYLRRRRLDEAFSEFMSDDCRVFVLAGGSGQGKTTWAARLLEKPPPRWTCDMIRAEEILAADGNIVPTLERLLLDRRTGEVSRRDFREAVWNWTDAANRIFVIDGLDRASAGARRHLGQWLESSARLTERVSVRFVITSRREALSTLLEGTLWKKRRVYGAAERSISFELGALEPDEADEIYAAYGVAAADHRGKRLRSPSLIRRYSRLKGAEAGRAVTRFDVLDADLAETKQELISKADLGQASVELFLERLGRSLVSSSDGWVSLEQLAGNAASLIRAADELVRGDRARLLHGSLRLESDDMIEMVMGHSLTPDEVAALLQSGRGDSLFIGGTAMMIARLEHERCDASAAIDTLLAGAAPGSIPPLNAVCRALLEVRRPEDFLTQADATVRLWQGDNFILYTSILADLIQDIALPASARLRLMLPLAHGEELDDWRDKYWFDPALGGRIVNPFGVAAERAVQEQPEEAIPILLPLLEGEDIDRAVGAFLLREAALLAPEAALNETWQPTVQKGRRAFGIVSTSIPGAALRFLGKAAPSHPQLISEITARVAELAAQEWPTPRPAPPAASDVLSATQALLPLVSNPQDEALLLIASLHAESGEDRRERLLELWQHVPNERYWDAFAVAGGDREGLLGELLRGEDPAHEAASVISRLSPDALAGANLEEIIHLLGDICRDDPRLEEPVASAVETLLYEIGPSADAGNTLLDVALELSGSMNDAVRSKLIYYAGSPCRTRQVIRKEIERRELILGELIDNETGSNLPQLVWKLGESAHERPAPLAHLMRLVYAHGTEAILDAIEPLAVLPYMGAMRDELLEALDDGTND